MNTTYFYTNDEVETVAGINLPLPCAPESILLVVEKDEEGNITNCYIPNDL
jgi:hypothetical protein